MTPQPATFAVLLLVAFCCASFLARANDSPGVAATALLTLAFFSLFAVLAHYGRRKKLAERQIATFKALYDSLPDIVSCKDVNGVYTSCNSGFEKLVGRREEDVIGRTTREIFAVDEEGFPGILEADEKVLAGSPMVRKEVSYAHPGFSRRLLETTKTPLIQNGRITGVLSIVRDITEYKTALAKAQEASTAKNTFLAHMSHEIRTPMNAFIGMTELAMRERDLDKIHEYLSFANGACADLLALVDDILDFSKIEAGMLEIKAEEYPFASLVNDVVSITRMKIGEKPILFTVNTDGAIPELLVGDIVRVREIFLNLLSNAAKYTDRGFITLSVRGEVDTAVNTVLLTAEVADSGFGIRRENLPTLFKRFSRFDTHKSRAIEGTGLGMAITKTLVEAMGGSISVTSEYGKGSVFTASIPQGFIRYKKFAELDAPASVLLYEPRPLYADSLARALNDLGARCARAVSEQDFADALAKGRYDAVFMASSLYDPAIRATTPHMTGKLVLVAEPGETAARTIRTITMPAHAAAIAAILNDADETRLDGDKTGAAFTAPSARVLVVDDINTNLIVAKGLMTPYAMRIDVCASGAEAIRLVQEKTYDIVFMDHAMPGMDGVEATAAIRSLEDGDGRYAALPVIALTANAVTGMKEMFLQNKFSDFLSKPIKIPELNAILKKWIPKEKQERCRAGADTKPEALLALGAIAGVDMELGLVMHGGNADHYLQTLRVFHGDGLEIMRELEESLAGGDLKLYTTRVHALKSASMSVGAKRVSDFAKTLEDAGKNGQAAYIAENSASFLAELDALLSGIRAALAHRAKAPGTDGDDHAFPRASLQELKDALADLDTGKTRRIMKDMQAKSWDAETAEAIPSLARSILLCEYDEAAALISALLARHELRNEA